MMLLHLIRHAHAGSRSDWDGDDVDRPLSKKGRRQADAIAADLYEAGIDLLWTSPYVRCRQTLEPLAAKLGLSIEDAQPFCEGEWGPPALDAVLAAAAAGHTVAVCSHGDVLPAVVATAVRRGATLVGSGSPSKGARYVCTVVDGQITELIAIDAPG